MYATALVREVIVIGLTMAAGVVVVMLGCGNGVVIDVMICVVTA